MSRHSNTPATDASVLLVQLSDSHLFAEDGARLLGMDTAHSLEKVVERVAREQPELLVGPTGEQMTGREDIVRLGRGRGIIDYVASLTDDRAGATARTLSGSTGQLFEAGSGL